MKSLEYLNKIITVKIDRPIGTKHENYPTIYPLNYGYVPNTVSGDGEELDVYILGIYEPLEEFTGKCIAIVHRLNDNDDKLIVVPENLNFSNSEIKTLTFFQEQYFKSEIIREKDYIEWSENVPELSVSNLEKSLEFYKTIGFKIGYEKPENSFAFIYFNNIQFMLQEITENEKWNLTPLSSPFGNGIIFQLEVPNVQKIYDALKENNTLLGNKEFLIKDPDGYLLHFFRRY